MIGDILSLWISLAPIHSHCFIGPVVILKLVFGSFGLIQIVFLFMSYSQMGTYRKTSEFLLSGEFYTPLIVACSDPANFDDDHRILSASGIENGEEPPTFKRTRTLWKVEDFVYKIFM